MMFLNFLQGALSEFPFWMFGRPVVRRTAKARSKYMPHQGKRECARRVRQMQQREIKAILRGERRLVDNPFLTPDGRASVA